MSSLILSDPGVLRRVEDASASFQLPFEKLIDEAVRLYISMNENGSATNSSNSSSKKKRVIGFSAENCSYVASDFLIILFYDELSTAKLSEQTRHLL